MNKRTSDTVVNKLFSSDSVVGKVKQKAVDKFHDVSGKSIELLGGVELMSQTANSTGLGPVAVAATLAADKVKGVITHILIDKMIKSGLDKYNTKENMVEYKDISADLGGALERAGEEKGTIFGSAKVKEFVNSLGYIFKDDPATTFTVDKKVLDDAAIFDNRVYDSVVKVIPGMLSKIYSELKSSRNGENPYYNEIFYNNRTSEFMNRESLKEDMLGTMSKNAEENTSKSVAELVEILSSQELVGDKGGQAQITKAS